MDRTESKSPKKALSPTFKIVLSAVIVFAATLLYMPSSGIFRTIPFMFFAGVLAGILGLGTGVSCVCAGVLNLCVYFAHGFDMWQTFLFTLFSVLLVFEGIYVAKLVKTAVKTSKANVRNKCVILAVAAVVVVAALSLLLCGNVVSFVKYDGDNTDYIQKNYKEKIEKSYTIYSWNNGEYRTYVTFKHGDIVVGAEDDCYISTKGESVTDNVRDYYENIMLREADMNLAKVVLNATSAFEVTESDIIFKDGEILSENSKLEDYNKRVAYVVSFYSIIDNREDFEILCRDTVSVIKNAGYEYEKIVFCAGTASDIRYSLTITPETSKDDVSSLVKEYDDNDVVRFGIDENTILDYWNNV